MRRGLVVNLREGIALIRPIHEVFYIEMIAFHIKTIFEKTERVNYELDAIAGGSSDTRGFQEKSDSLLNAFQEILRHAAAISRYFWPVKKGELHAERGQKLRSVYGIDETSPLYSRNVRNAIEHFDEKLDIFMESFPTGSIYPSYVGSRTKADADNIHCFRAYFIDGQVFRILDSEIHIPPILDEIGRINDLLSKQIVDGARLASAHNEAGASSQTISSRTDGLDR